MTGRLSARRAADLDPSGRSEERLRAHFEIERALAQRLRSAPAASRGEAYREVYNELFRRVPDHPQLTRADDPELKRRILAVQVEVVEAFLGPGETFLEIGAGDCALSFAVSGRAGKVKAVDVSAEIATDVDAPANFELLLTDGVSMPVADGSVDLAYSNQLMEHLHPDDARAQLQNIARALRPRGRYVCLTPQRLTGPADISAFFSDDEPLGFHLREYSNRELAVACRAAGFAEVQVVATLPGRVLSLPLAPFAAAERVFEALPRWARRRLKRSRVVRKALSPGGGVVARLGDA